MPAGRIVPPFSGRRTDIHRFIHVFHRNLWTTVDLCTESVQKTVRIVAIHEIIGKGRSILYKIALPGL